MDLPRQAYLPEELNGPFVTRLDMSKFRHANGLGTFDLGLGTWTEVVRFIPEKLRQHRMIPMVIQEDDEAVSVLSLKRVLERLVIPGIYTLRTEKRLELFKQWVESL